MALTGASLFAGGQADYSLRSAHTHRCRGGCARPGVHKHCQPVIRSVTQLFPQRTYVRRMAHLRAALRGHHTMKLARHLQKKHSICTSLIIASDSARGLNPLRTSCISAHPLLQSHDSAHLPLQGLHPQDLTRHPTIPRNQSPGMVGSKTSH